MTTVPASQRLINREDWKDWYSSVSRRARRDNIWDYCNPELQDNPSEGTPSASVLRVLVEPKRPLPSMVRAEATELSDLTDAELKRWTIFKEDYNDRQREYIKKSTALAELDSYIEATVDRSNQPILRDLTTPYSKLKALKQKLEPTPRQQKQAAAAQYQAVQKWTTKSELDTWLRDYRNAYLEAKAVKLPQVDDFNPHYDFVKAIAAANPACSTALHSILVQKEQSDSEPPDFSESCLQFFETWQRTQQASQPTATHTGFATFQGQPLQPPEGQPDRANQQASKGHGHGKGNQGSQPHQQGSQQHQQVCKFCGYTTHQSEKCFYIDSRLRPASWHENPRTKKKVDENLASDPALRQEAEQIRKKQLPSPDVSTSQSVTWNNPATQPSHPRTAMAATALEGSKSASMTCPQPQEAGAQSTMQTGSLLHCWILDPGADTHVSNNLADFTWQRDAQPGDQLMAGETISKIQAWGKATITVAGPHGPQQLILHDVAYIPTFFTNLVSLDLGVGLGFDSHENLVYLTANRSPFCYTTRKGGHWLLMARDEDPEAVQLRQGVAQTAQRPRPSKDRRLITKDAEDEAVQYTEPLAAHSIDTEAIEDAIDLPDAVQPAQTAEQASSKEAELTEQGASQLLTPDATPAPEDDQLPEDDQPPEQLATATEDDFTPFSSTTQPNKPAQLRQLSAEDLPIEAPRLWYPELVSTLRRLGFEPVPGVNCLFTNGHLLVFFYVDDIEVLALPQHIKELQQFKNDPMATYEPRALGELRWFLGIKVERDRQNRTIWLSQESYIEQLAPRASMGYLVSYDSTNIFLIWNLNNSRIYRGRDVLCDNLQTVRILTKGGFKLDTKLKHVDIHQHWLRQEVEAGHIHIKWIPTAQMPADGLTKLLPPQRHETFVKQVGLVQLSKQPAS